MSIYTRDMWRSELNSLRQYREDIFNEIDEWFPLGQGEIGFELLNGEVWSFDAFLRTHPRCLFDPKCRDLYDDRIDRLYSKEYLSEEEWRDRFINVMVKYMRFVSVGQELLSDECGLTIKTINKYLNGYSTPSLYHATKMATAFKCSLSCLYVPMNNFIDVRRIRTIEQWDAIIDDLFDEYPRIMKDVVYWFPVGADELVVKLFDNGKILFNLNDYSNRIVYNPHDTLDYIDEESWRLEFSERLRECMWDMKLTQSDLIRETGISQSTLSKYISGKVTPSLYNATKITRVLDRSLTKFQIT